MKKLNYLFLSALAVCLMACQKEANIAPERQTVHMTFGATTESATKVEIGALSAGKYQMLWSAGDQIKVIATTGAGVISGKGVFDIGSGATTNSATFSGDVVLEEGKTAADLVNFYALYPATLEATFAANESTISLTNYKNYNVLAVENGIDPSRSVMFSMADGSGNFQFQHGVAYYKLTIGIDDVASVTLKCPAGDERIYGNPTYNFSNGETTAIGSGSLSNNHITLAPTSGTLTKGSTYYFPVVTKYKAFGTLQLVYASSGGVEATIETSKLSSTVPANGNVYDLGCPPVTFAPKIIPVAPSKLEADATDGSFTYSVANPDGVSSVSAVKKSGDWISNVAASAGTVTFDCTVNTGDERTAVITLSYTGADDVDVTITQKAAGGGAKESHAWDFSALTDEQMAAITGLAANATGSAGQTWNFGDGLTMVTNSSSKWNKQTISEVNYKWVATGGKYGSGQKYFQFSTESTGTVTVLYSSGSDGSSRSLTINANGTETTDSANVSSGTADLKTVTFSSVASGTIKLYSNINNIRVFSISFLED